MFFSHGSCAYLGVSAYPKISMKRGGWKPVSRPLCIICKIYFICCTNSVLKVANKWELHMGACVSFLLWENLSHVHTRAHTSTPFLSQNYPHTHHTQSPSHYAFYSDTSTVTSHKQIVTHTHTHTNQSYEMLTSYWVPCMWGTFTPHLIWFLHC